MDSKKTRLLILLGMFMLVWLFMLVVSVGAAKLGLVSGPLPKVKNSHQAN